MGCVFVHDGKVIGQGLNDTNRSLNVRLNSDEFRLHCLPLADEEFADGLRAQDMPSL